MAEKSLFDQSSEEPKDKPEEKPEEKEEPKEEKEEPKEDPQPETRERDGLLKAVQAERAKRQELEARLLAAESQKTPPADYGEDPERFVSEHMAELERKFQRRLVDMSEVFSRNTHPDFQEKYDLFAEATVNNRPLLETILASDFPAEAAYQAGKQILIEKKYGRDFEAQKKKIVEETTKNLEKQIEEKLLAKLKDKSNQPTNILSARAAGGEDKPDWRPTTFADILSKKRG